MHDVKLITDVFLICVVLLLLFFNGIVWNPAGDLSPRRGITSKCKIQSMKNNFLLNPVGG